MLNLRLSVGRLVPAILLVLFLAFSPFGLTQDFTLQATTPNPRAVEPGGAISAIATVTVGNTATSSGASVTLSCLQSSGPTPSPTCEVSPSPITAPGNATATIAAPLGTPAGLFTYNVTGTDASGSLTVNLNVNVLDVSPEYTIAVTKAVNPTTVAAGNGTTAELTITPINGYTGKITLSCSNISPAAEPPPTCSFSPQPLQIISATPQSSTMTISTTSTTGPTTTASAGQLRPILRPRWVFALCLAAPGLGFVALGVGSAPRRRWMSFLALTCVLAAALFFPACGSSKGNSNNPVTTGTTPKNTYTLTIAASDANGVAASNGTLNVSITVN